MQNGDMFAGACLDNDEKLVYTMYILALDRMWHGFRSCMLSRSHSPAAALALRRPAGSVERCRNQNLQLSSYFRVSFPHLSRFKAEETWMEVTCDDYSWNILKLLWSLVALNATCRKVRWCSLYFLLLWQRCALRFSSLWASVLSPFG